MEARRASLYEWVRQIRGAVLGGAFTVERRLGAVITYFMLGDRVKRDEVLGVFDEALVVPLTFERRINAVRFIVPEFMSVDDAKILQGNLNELRTIRNVMAHKPFWFHPELNDDGEVFNIVPMIQRGKVPVALTTSFIEELNERITGLIDQTSKLAEVVRTREVG